MRPISLRTHISAPREEIFDLVADLSYRLAWCDHYMKDLRMTSPAPEGRGGAARAQLDSPGRDRYTEIHIEEADRPRRIVEVWRTGRLGRTELFLVYELSDEVRGLTTVELDIWSQPSSRSASRGEGLRTRSWLKRRTRKALERLRLIFEEPPSEPLARATVAGYEPLTSPRFGISTPTGAPLAEPGPR